MVPINLKIEKTMDYEKNGRKSRFMGMYPSPFGLFYHSSLRKNNDWFFYI